MIEDKILKGNSNAKVTIQDYSFLKILKMLKYNNGKLSNNNFFYNIFFDWNVFYFIFFKKN